MPKTRDHEEPFYPQSLERGRRRSRAVMMAIAEMYVQGLSTRDATKVMKEFGLERLSSTQVSRAAALLDDELDAWRRHQLEPVTSLFLDALYEKVRDNGVVRDAAILSAVGITPDGRRRVLGVSCALSEAEVHWRDFLNDLVSHGLRGGGQGWPKATARNARRAEAMRGASLTRTEPMAPWSRSDDHR